LLYPKADPQRRIMVYGCRICQYDELVDNKCVYRNDLLTVTKYVFMMRGCPHEHMFSGNKSVSRRIWVRMPRWYDVLLSTDGHRSSGFRVRLIPIFPAHGVVTMSEFIDYCPTCISAYPIFCSSVFYQDQSKRKETRMILFFVCTKCNHSFTDPTLPTDSRPEMEDG